MQNRRDVAPGRGSDQARETGRTSDSKEKRKWVAERDATNPGSRPPEQQHLIKLARIALPEGSSDQVLQGRSQEQQDGGNTGSSNSPERKLKDDTGTKASNLEPFERYCLRFLTTEEQEHFLKYKNRGDNKYKIKEEAEAAEIFYTALRMRREQKFSESDTRKELENIRINRKSSRILSPEGSKQQKQSEASFSKSFDDSAAKLEQVGSSRQDSDPLHSEDGPPQSAERPNKGELTSLVNKFLKLMDQRVYDKEVIMKRIGGKFATLELTPKELTFALGEIDQKGFSKKDRDSKRAMFKKCFESNP